jgi:hypothetical protein
MLELAAIVIIISFLPKALGVIKDFFIGLIGGILISFMKK